MHSLIRMILVPLCPLVVAVWVYPAHYVNADDLFSEVALEAVFQAGDSPASSLSPRREALAGAQRVTGAGSLSIMLEEAGLVPQKLENQVVSVTLHQAGWALPVLISVNVDQDRMDMVMLLAEAGADTQWDAAKLVKLFAANSEESTVFFGFNSTRGRMELRRSLPNRGITPARLKQELTRLALVAETYEDTWSQVTMSAGKPPAEADPNALAASLSVSPSGAAVVAEPTAPPVQAVPQKDSTPSASATPPATPQPTLTLVGRWSTSVGDGEAFALQIARGGTFQLVHAKSGKTTLSQGTATLSGNQLTLSDPKSTKIVGTVKQTVAEAFTLVIGSDAAVSLDFKRANE